MSRLPPREARAILYAVMDGCAPAPAIWAARDVIDAYIPEAGPAPAPDDTRGPPDITDWSDILTDTDACTDLVRESADSQGDT